MRTTYGVVAFLAVIAALGGIRANGAATIAAGTDPSGTGAARLVAPSALGMRPAGSSGVSVPKPRPNVVRIAQKADTRSTGNPSVAPLKWAGMLVNPTPTKTSPNAVEECTAEFIKPNVLLTAGHCVKDIVDTPTGPFYDLTKQYFLLQYQNGESSMRFKTVCAATNPKWTVPSNYKSLKPADQDAAFLAAAEHDFAMILVDGMSPTGVMPYQLDWKGKWVDATRVGYASDILNGKVIQRADGIVFFAQQIPMFATLHPGIVVHWQQITDLTNGTSGGAWIANFTDKEADGNNVLIAVTSFNNSDYPGAEMAAYLTAAEFNPLLQYVSNGCKGTL
jgi:hypothetical protein